MSRIKEKFLELKNKKEKALIPYLTCGYPTLKDTEELALTLFRAGADIIELGIPYSDPLADGPIIQAASHKALQNNIKIDQILTTIERLRKRVDIPLVIMSYYNPVFKYGEEKFLRSAKTKGVDGIIISDLPVEEAMNFKKKTYEFSLDLILLIAPTTTDKRIKLIAEISSGFIYAISRTGVTGIQQDLYKGLANFIYRIKRVTTCPIAVGFGISNAEQVEKVSSFADGIVVGSALIRLIEENYKNKKRLHSKVRSFIKEIKKGCVK